jgi:REP element-mobilizing transposase RayT
MARQARGQSIDPAEVQVVHCIHRCVRRAFLCGQDPYSGKCYEHRRQWIRQRLEFLASVFAIDCLTYCVMSNHLHLVLRSRPDLVATWSDEQVARRWLRLYPMRRGTDGPVDPTDDEINTLLRQPKEIQKLRQRLSDISWWMRCTAETIARQSNREDECTGHFWEGRFRSQLILDEAGLLACAAYVDLNPIRAALAKSPETSEFTGIKDRIDDLKTRSDRARISDHQWERNRRRANSGWMSPIEIDARRDPVGPEPSRDERRASWKGFLSISLSAYLQLVDWTGRQFRRDKVGAIPDHLAPILTRLGLGSEAWCDLIQDFGRKFKRAVGSQRHLHEEAARRGQRWLQSPGHLDLATG